MLICWCNCSRLLRGAPQTEARCGLHLPFLLQQRSNKRKWRVSLPACCARGLKVLALSMSLLLPAMAVWRFMVPLPKRITAHKNRVAGSRNLSLQRRMSCKAICKGFCVLTTTSGIWKLRRMTFCHPKGLNSFISLKHQKIALNPAFSN